jgi:hypothetical protein
MVFIPHPPHQYCLHHYRPHAIEHKMTRRRPVYPLPTISHSIISQPPSIPLVCQESYYRDNTNYTSSKMLLKGLSLSSSKLPKYCRCCGAVEVNGTNLFETMIINTTNANDTNSNLTTSNSRSCISQLSSNSRSRSNSPKNQTIVAATSKRQATTSKHNTNHVASTTATSPTKQNSKKKEKRSSSHTSSSQSILTIPTCSSMILSQSTPLFKKWIYVHHVIYHKD